MGVPIETVIAEMETFVGTRYLFGGEETNCAPNDIDCSEGVESACRCTGVSPTMPDGSGNQFNHCDKAGLRIPFDQARNTRGALIFKSYGTSYPPGDRDEGGIYHVAMVTGSNQTMEICCSDGDSVGHMKIDGRSWYGWGGLIPGADYGAAPTPIPPEPPAAEVLFTVDFDEGGTVTLRELRQGLSGRDVRETQVMLNDWGMGAGTVDGEAGPKFDAAVKSFQSSRGLTADGIVGARTHQSLMGR